ncbi:hypothetical protein HELRODRAFT_181255 [Helobdella robusta]|uniref:Uncharacterized protein n=1 Tax=Helobdella robusta TaxID=6412 RepID=T1FGT1_HELRO|nr:hypothetical protein HELRODRAFT_181255 [Helobdella robusta]ESN93148.1 hypothetical protein HELRODRAFT_181255 [Helobdella robusta]
MAINSFIFVLFYSLLMKTISTFVPAINRHEQNCSKENNFSSNVKLLNNHVKYREIPSTKSGVDMNDETKISFHSLVHNHGRTEKPRPRAGNEGQILFEINTLSILSIFSTQKDGVDTVPILSVEDRQIFQAMSLKYSWYMTMCMCSLTFEITESLSQNKIYIY